MAGGVLISQASDVAWVMADPRFTRDVAWAPRWRRSHYTDAPSVFVDGDEHNLYRRAMASSLDARFREPFLRQAADRVEGHLARLPHHGVVELMGQMILPLARELTLDLLGVLPPDRPGVERHFRHGLTFAFHHTESLLRFPRVSSSDSRGASRLRADVRQAVQTVFTRSGSSDDGVLSTMRRLHRQNTITLDAACALVERVLAATFEPVAYSLGNSLLALAERPALCERLRVEPGLVPGAVAELMRYDSMVQTIYRYAKEDVALHGQIIRRGELVILLLGSANRDPRYFPDADEIDFDRPARTQFTFGHGSHFCLGAAIVQGVLGIALTQFIDRYRSIRIDSHPTWYCNLPMRGLSRLPLALGG
jgi:cytochrome P450